MLEHDSIMTLFSIMRPGTWPTVAVIGVLIGCVRINPAFDMDGGSEDVGDGDGDPGDGDTGDGDGEPGDGDGDGEPGDGDGDGEPGDGDGEPGCVAPLIDCFGECVDVDTSASHCGGCGMPCEGLCEQGMCDPSAERLVFLSSHEIDGEIGGLEGADEFCSSLAAAAGLEGQFKAWLSTAQLGPAARMNHFPGPYRLLDGTLIANGWADLTDGTLAHPIDRNENGEPHEGGWICEGNEVWTNTKPNGTPASNTDCGGWLVTNATSTTGRSTANDASWTQSSCVSVDCQSGLPVYCVQQ